jgi:two-component system, OmpR family, sensor kinase
MRIPFFSRLYVRIWLAVVAAVMVLTMVFAWLWRAQTDRQRLERLADQPLRELVVRDTAGTTVAKTNAKSQGQGRGLEFELTLPDGKTWFVQVPPAPRVPAGSPGAPVPPRWMEANMQRNPGFMLLLWGVLAFAVALGSYPIMRRLTQRLEALRRGVERWGAGNLSHRVSSDGRDEVAYLGQRFNLAADRIEALVQAHKTLLANASHELRSPLARIRMGLELTDQAPSPALKAELARSIGELDALIDEILLASRLDAAQHSSGIDFGHSENVDMVALAAEECARLGITLHVQGHGQGHGQLQVQLANANANTNASALSLHASAGPAAPSQNLSVHGVPRLLRRAVRNLLENANRYGSPTHNADVPHALPPHSDSADPLQPSHLEAAGPEAPVQMTLRALPAGTGTINAGDLPMVELEVCDRGPGVPEAEHKKIFEPFYRSSNASERDGGVGLGLSLVQSIARSHGGSVHCQPRSGGGACFVVRLSVGLA